MPERQTTIKFNIDDDVFDGDPNEMTHEDNPYDPDVWRRMEQVMIREHNVPRLPLFDPSKCVEEAPVALEHFNVVRIITTDIDNDDERRDHMRPL